MITEDHMPFLFTHKFPFQIQCKINNLIQLKKKIKCISKKLKYY